MKYTILKFEKPGCAPCNAVDELLKKHDINVTKINLIDNPSLAKEFGVMSVPTILVLDNQNEIQYRIIGVVEHALISLKEEINGGQKEGQK